MRSFPHPAVYESIAQHVVGEAAPPACSRIFYVLELSSRHDSGRSGSFEYNSTTLWRTAWRRLPPTDYLFDPGVPEQRAHSSYRDARCWFGCIFMYVKERLCLDMVERFEVGAERRFNWMIISRPDLIWGPGTGLRSLGSLPRDAIFGFQGKFDQSLVVPRYLLTPLLDAVLARCFLPEEAPMFTNVCHDWVVSRALAAGMRVIDIELDFNVTDRDVKRGYRWEKLVSWNLKAAAMMRRSVKDVEMRRLGHTIEKPWDFRNDLRPAELAGCVTRIESSMCLNQPVALLEVSFQTTLGAEEEPWATMLHVSVWRPIGSGRVHANTSEFSMQPHLFDIDVGTLRGKAYNSSVEMTSVPIILKRGRCVAWTACSIGRPEPIRVVQSHAIQPAGMRDHDASRAGIAMVRKSTVRPHWQTLPTNQYGNFRAAEERVYAFSIKVQGVDV